MPKLRADKPLRVACGLGLLLLLAAHEKACPWLWIPPQADKPDAAAPPTDPADKSPTKKAPKRLPHVLPEVAAPRWPTGWPAGASRPSDPRDQTGTPNPVAGDDSVRLLPANTPIRGWWLDFQPPAAPVACVAAAVVGGVPPDPAVQTCIRRTGPPPVIAG